VTFFDILLIKLLNKQEQNNSHKAENAVFCPLR